MRRQGTILESAGCEKPGAAIGLEGEGIGAGVEVDAGAIGPGGRIGCLGVREVRTVEARPLALRRVPPDIFLALGPGVALWVG